MLRAINGLLNAVIKLIFIVAMLAALAAGALFVYAFIVANGL